MDQKLLNKEVLCLFDIRQIQRYLFQSNSDLDTVGGDNMVGSILVEAIEHAVTHVKPSLSPEEYSIDSEDAWERIPYFLYPDIKVQLISSAAGNALILFRSGRICRKISRLVSRYFLDHTYSLEIAVCAVEKTENIIADIDHMYRKMERIKYAADQARPYCPIPIIEREKTTGAPVIARDPELGDLVSAESTIRRAAVRKAGHMVRKEDIRLLETNGEKRFMAIGHIDGNNMGVSIAKIFRGIKSYEEGLRFRRIITYNIKTAYQSTLDEIEQIQREQFKREHLSEKEMKRQFHILHSGGDDLNIMCNAKYAMPFASEFIKRIRKKTYWQSKKEKVYFSVCAGLAFITPDITFHDAYALAEDCCASAKKTAKLEENLINGLTGNWIDFQFRSVHSLQNLETVRERAFKTDRKTNLLLRPYSFDENQKDSPLAYGRFEKRCRFMTSGALSQEEMAQLKLSYEQGRKETLSVYRLLKRYGVAFPGDTKGPYAMLPYTGEYHAVWYDVLECSVWNWNTGVSE